MLQTSRTGLRPLGLVVFHRHGDRSPVHNVFKTQHAFDTPEVAAEDSKWMKRVVWEPKEDLLKAGDPARPPVVAVGTENTPEDAMTKLVDRESNAFPFRQLTSTGFEQCVSLGEQLKRTELSPFLDSGNREINSLIVSSRTTMYSRTLQSAQCVLRGIIQHDENSDSTALLNEPRVMWASMHEDSANAWERPAVLERIRDIAERSFGAEEDKMQAVKDVLCAELPYLSFKPFLWVEAADFYTCMEAHGDSIQSEALKLVRNQVLDHTAWRFLQWYQNPEVLRATCGDILEELWTTCWAHLNVEANSCGVVPLTRANDRDFQVTLVSTHDVMMMPLVYLFGGFQSIPVGTKNGLYPRLWPGYASSLRIEIAESSGRIWIRPSYQQRVGGRVVELSPLGIDRFGFVLLENVEQTIRAKLGQEV